MFYVKITTDKGGSSMTRTDSTILTLGGQSYIRKMSDADHEKLVTAIETAIMAKKPKLTVDNVWSAR